MADQELGPTGEILYDLPSPYIPHPCGLLYLPRFIAKIRKHLAGELPKSYQRNFTKGFDGFLCLHLGIEPRQVIELVKKHGKNDAALNAALNELFPEDLNIPKWNRRLVQAGMSEAGREALADVKKKMGLEDRRDLVSFADMIDKDEGRLE